MSEQTREAWSEQSVRVLHTIDKAAKNAYKKMEHTDQTVTIPIAMILGEADAHRGSFYDNNYHVTINNLAGCKYLFDKGKVRIKPETYIRNRRTLDEDELE